MRPHPTPIGPEERLLFFGDAHLTLADPGRTERVCRFLRHASRSATRIYCVGDLFEYWAGPVHRRLPDYQEILSCLREVSRAGASLAFIQGNRDFLFGREEGRAVGIQVHAEGIALALPESRVWICHGDSLCTHDRWNLRMRRMIRSWPVRRLWRRLPGEWMESIAVRARRQSRVNVARKDPQPMGRTLPAAVRHLCDGYEAVICGHVHRESTVSVQRADGRAAGTLYTLGEWTALGGSVLTWEAGRFRFEQFE